MRIYRANNIRKCKNCANELLPDLKDPCLECMTEYKYSGDRPCFVSKNDTDEDENPYMVQNIGMPPRRSTP